MKGKAFCNFLFQHGRSESGDIDTKPWSEGGKADQSDPAEGGGGGAVIRPAADPAAGRTPAKAVGRRRFCKKVLPRSQRRRGLYITQVMGHFP